MFFKNSDAISRRENAGLYLEAYLYAMREAKPLQSGADEMTEIVNNKAQHRYELAVDGHVAATYYQIAAGVITFTHTEVPPELGGKGIGSKLIKGALDQVRAEGLKVVAQCPFVKAYIEKHNEYADLLK
jgi:predicted GNAT family acetyltransferase